MSIFARNCTVLFRGCAILIFTLAASACQQQYLDPTAGAAPNSPTGLPTPAIVSVSPSSGRVGSSVTIAGINFGATQGANTVTFNGVTGTPMSWATNNLVVTVPAGAASGSVIVTAGGLPSNAVTFTVTP
jgi:IPT/TIG domain